MAKAPLRIPVGNLSSKLARPFATVSGETVDTASGGPVVTENVVAGNRGLPETVELLEVEAALPVSSETVANVVPSADITSQHAATAREAAARPPGKPGSPLLGNTAMPQQLKTVSTEKPFEVKKQTSLALPWDVKKRLAIWRAQLRAEGLPATESGIVVALVRAATLGYAREVLTAPRAVEEETP